MISLQLIIEGKYDYGCVMARIDEEISCKLLDFNCRTIGEECLYVEEENHGREKTPHITVKFGLTKSYSEDQMREILRETRPFLVELHGISLFENKKFDVVKFDVESRELRSLNEMLSRLPNHDIHPIYNPHMTLAYVKPGMGKKFIRKPTRFAKVPVNLIEYSDRGVKSFYRL